MNATMIDIHHHCLPDVDDGPTNWEDAVAMCRMAREEGIEVIVATPHVLRGLWSETPKEELDAKVRELNERLGGSPTVLLGSEYFFGHDMAEVLAAGEPIIPLAGSGYVLVELAAHGVPPGIEGPFYRARLAGWTPILAHPERNLAFQSHPDLLRPLVESGVRTQITAGSLTGAFGRAARRAAEEFLARGFVHLVATDGHNPGKRPPLFRAAREVLEQLGGAGLVRALTYDNPLAVIQNRPMPFDPEPAGAPPDGFLTRLGAFFSRNRA